METESLTNKLKNLYGLSIDSQALQKAEGGFLSTNFVVTTNEQKSFLKKYRMSNPEKIKEIHSIKKYFSEKGIPIILPITNKEKITYFEDNGSAYALFPFVKGVHFDRQALPEKAITSLAETLGRIHLAGRDYAGQAEKAFKLRSPENFSEEAQKYLKIIQSRNVKDHFDTIAEKTILLRLELFNKLGYSLESLNLNCDHLVHGDYHDKNVFLDPEGEVTHVYDFEKTGMSPRVAELYRSLDYICLNGLFNEESFSKASNYLKSYSNIYPIDSGELYRGLKLYYLKLIFSLWVEKSHYTEDNTRMDEFLEGQYKTLQYFSENLDTFFKEVTK